MNNNNNRFQRLTPYVWGAVLGFLYAEAFKRIF